MYPINSKFYFYEKDIVKIPQLIKYILKQTNYEKSWNGNFTQLPIKDGNVMIDPSIEKICIECITENICYKIKLENSSLLFKKYWLNSLKKEVLDIYINIFNHHTGKKAKEIDFIEGDIYVGL